MKNRQGYLVSSVLIVIFLIACNFLQPRQRETPATFTPLPLSTTTPTPESTPTSISTAIISDSTEIKPTTKWTKPLAEINNNNFKMVRSINGSVYILALSDKKFSLIKLDSNGEKIWGTMIDKVSFHGIEGYSFSIALDSEDNVYISGQSAETWGNPINPFYSKPPIYLDEFNGFDTFIVKLNSSGSIVWNTFLNAAPCSSIVLDKDNNIFIAAGYNFNNQDYFIDQDYSAYPISFFLFKLNGDGNILWTKDYGYNKTILPPFPYSIKIDPNGDLYVLASTDDFVPLIPPLRGPSSTSDSILPEIFLAKFKDDGTLLWNTFIGGSGSGGIHSSDSLEIDQYANIYIAGTNTANWGNPIVPLDTDGKNLGGAFLAKFDTSGNLLWNTYLGSDFTHNSLEVEPVSGISYVAGTNQRISIQNSDTRVVENLGGIIVEIDSNGNLNKKIPLKENGFITAESIILGKEQEYYIIGTDETQQFNVSYISLIPEPIPTEIPEVQDEAKYREGGPLVPEITTYIPTPKDISTDPLIIIINLALAFSIAVLVLPFSITLDIFLGWVHGISDRFLDWRKQIQEKTINILGLKLSREQRSYIDTLKPIAEIFNLFIVILFYGVVFSLLDPDWNIFSLKGIVLLVEMVVAYGIVGIFDDIIQWFYIRRWGTPGKFTVRITNVILAGASVIISRSIPLSPGLMFGSPEAVRVDESVLGKNRIWFLTKISLISYVVIGLLAWIPTIILDFLVQQELQVLPQTVKDIIAGIEGFMLIVFAVSLENVFIQLIGFSGGIGKKVREKNWLLWLAVWIPVAFLFLQTLLNPRNDFFNGFQSRNAFFALACMAGFIVIVLAMALIKFLISRNVVKK